MMLSVAQCQTVGCPVNNELERTWEELALAEFNVLSHLPGGTE
jgi:hypothetical protein